MIQITKTCPQCGSIDLVCKGHNQKNGKQKYHCNGCDKYGTLDAAPRYSEERKEEILKAYFERPSMRGIERVFGVALQTVSAWLKQQGEKHADLEATLSDVPAEQDVLEYDELQHFINKSQKRWLWTGPQMLVIGRSVISRKTRKIIAFFIGDHSMESCKILWQTIPERFRYQTSFSDFWEAYNCIYQKTAQHQKVGKESGQTNHMEPWNNTIRQWMGRLTRKTLSFSKSDFYNQLVIRLFIVGYNISKSVST
jgi:IS1 family transposase/transposase-like protein